MIGFAAAAAALVAGTLALLLRPWWRGEARDLPGPDARTLRRRLYLQQRDEWARERAGIDDRTTSPGVADEAAIEAELQRRLLDDLSPTVDDGAVPREASAAPRGRDRTPWVLALAVPVLAAAGYAWLGHPEALDAARGAPVAPAAHAEPGAPAASETPMTAATVMARVEALAARLREHPDDPAGWTRLARAWRVLGRASEAQAAYEHIGPSMQDDATLLAEYADAIAAQRGGRLDDRAAAALRRALAVDPRNPTALSLAATAAWNAHDVDEARRRWRQLLDVLPPGSTDAGRVRAWLARLPASAATAAASR